MGKSPQLLIVLILSASLAACAASQPSKDDDVAPIPNPRVPEKVVEDAIAAHIEPADLLNRIFLLKSFNSSGEEIGQGSGFVHEGTIVTNAHVVADASWIQVLNDTGKHVTTAPYAIHVDTENDLAVLPFPGNNDPGLPLASGDPKVGEDIWAFGSPLGFQNTVSKGNVSALRKEKGLIQITAPISSGSSGGPVTNTAGQVIGVVVGVYSEGQNINFAIPVDRLPSGVSSRTASVAFPSSSDIGGEETLTPAQNFMLFSVMRASIVEYGEHFKVSYTDEDIVGEIRMKVFMFEGSARQNVEVAALSDRADVTLMLYKADFEEGFEAWNVTDQGGGLGRASLIRTQLPVDGDYFLAAVIEKGSTGELGLWFGDIPQTLALNPRWVRVGVGNETRTYIDTKSITPSYGVYRSNGPESVDAWFYMDHSPAEKRSDGKEYYASIFQVSLFCKSREYRVLDMARLSADGRENVPGYNPRESVMPETNGERMWESACNSDW